MSSSALRLQIERDPEIRSAELVRVSASGGRCSAPWATLAAYDVWVSDLDTTGTLFDQVASIWTEVLEADDMEHTADFFDLGGQSLGAIRITAQVREILNDDVPLALIFEEPVLSEYVAALAPYSAD